MNTEKFYVVIIRRPDTTLKEYYFKYEQDAKNMVDHESKFNNRNRTVYMETRLFEPEGVKY